MVATVATYKKAGTQGKLEWKGAPEQNTISPEYKNGATVFLKPDYLIDGDITDIDLEELERAGIKGLILDLDSTLIAPKSAYISEQALAWLDRARRKFQVAVASNNKNEVYLDKVRKLLNIRIIGKARSPAERCSGAFWKSLI